MIYQEYDEYLRRYHEAQRKYNDILTDKEILFNMTQPKSVDTSKESVKGGFKPSNAFDGYLILKEQKRIDERLNEAKNILEERYELLNMKKAELIESSETLDRVYLYRFVQNMKVNLIATKLSYSEMQIYRYLREIKKNLNHVKKS